MNERGVRKHAGDQIRAFSPKWFRMMEQLRPRKIVLGSNGRHGAVAPTNGAKVTTRQLVPVDRTKEPEAFEEFHVPCLRMSHCDGEITIVVVDHSDIGAKNTEAPIRTKSFIGEVGRWIIQLIA